VLGKGKDGVKGFSEREARKGSFGLMEGAAFLPMLFSP
jgi:2,3-bisphosphoglycerate-independent phosphoglycerate mutase